jgi:hypothetical protein
MRAARLGRFPYSPRFAHTWKPYSTQPSRGRSTSSSTRETELAETYPIQVVCDWIGNTAAVAAKHYLQVTDEHYRQAAQIPVQYAHEMGVRARNTK